MRTLRWWTRLAVVVAALLPYMRLPSCPLYPDAERAVKQNPAVVSGSFHDVLTSDFWGRKRGDPTLTGSYRPAVSLTYWLQARVTGVAPAPLHLFDMALHATAAVLVLLLLESLLASGMAALAGALIFAVHPALSEAVASVVGRADLMAGASFLAAWLLHRHAARHGRSFDLIALGCLAIALFSKEYAVVFPFLLWFFDELESRFGDRTATSRRAERRHSLVFAAAGVGLVAINLWTRASVLGTIGDVTMVVGEDTPLAGFPFHARVANAVWLLLPAARLLLLPIGLDHVYGIGTLPIATGLADPRFLVAFATIAALTGLAIRRARRHADPRPLVALALFVVPLLPALNTIGVTVLLFAERFLYVPGIGFAIAVGWAFSRVVPVASRFGGRKNVEAETRDPGGDRRRAIERFAPAALLVLVLAGAILTARRVEDWRSNEALARAAVRAHPHSAMALFELGMARARQGAFEEAARLTRASLDVQDTRPHVWRGYALVLDQLGREADAIDAWSRALAATPRGISPNRAWMQGLAAAEARAARSPAAIAALRAASQSHPDDPLRKRNLARVLLQAAVLDRAQGRLPDAAPAAREAVQVGALEPEELFRAGTILAVAGDTAMAAAAIQRAQALDGGLLARKRREAADALAAGRAGEASDVLAGMLAVAPDDVLLQRDHARALAQASE